MPKARDDNEDLNWLERDANQHYEATGEIPDLWTLMALREARNALPSEVNLSETHLIRGVE